MILRNSLTSPFQRLKPKNTLKYTNIHCLATKQRSILEARAILGALIIEGELTFLPKISEENISTFYYKMLFVTQLNSQRLF